MGDVTRAVEDHVEGRALGEQGADGGGVGDVESPRLDRLERGERGLVDVGRQHPRPLGRECLSRRPPDPLAGGGDETELALEAVGHLAIGYPLMLVGPSPTLAGGRTIEPDI